MSSVASGLGEAFGASQPASETLELRHCRKGFKRAAGRGRAEEYLHVIDDISLVVSPRQIVSLLGPSGCGKTTLLRMILGLASLDGGEIVFNGQPINNPAETFSVVFQDFRILPWRTVRTNVAFALELKFHRKLAKADWDEVDKYLEAVGLSDFRHSYPHELSGGMRQRVGVARALARRSKVLLLDEPFGALDAQTRMLMQDLYLAIHDEFELTTLLITHDIDEAIYMSSECVVLTGRPTQIKEQVKIDLPQPRHLTDARIAPDFLSYRAHIWNLLPHVMQGTA